MEKSVIKAKNKFLAFLPKAAAVMRIEFENPPQSPGRDKRASVNAANKQKPHQSRGYSGPITSVVFEEARTKSKHSRFEAKEPTSPKISCMGQIKHKKKKNQKMFTAAAKPFSSVKTTGLKKKEEKNSRNIISKNAKLEGRKSDAYAEMSRLPDRAPSLSQMKRFASSRDSLSKFDWTTAQVLPDQREMNHHSGCYSDGEEDEEEAYDVIIPFSAPLMAEVEAEAPLQPKKEINLWKRRSTAQPKPLKLNKP